MARGTFGGEAFKCMTSACDINKVPLLLSTVRRGGVSHIFPLPQQFSALVSAEPSRRPRYHFNKLPSKQPTGLMSFTSDSCICRARSSIWEALLGTTSWYISLRSSASFPLRTDWSNRPSDKDCPRWEFERRENMPHWPIQWRSLRLLFYGHL